MKGLYFNSIDIFVVQNKNTKGKVYSICIRLWKCDWGLQVMQSEEVE